MDHDIGLMIELWSYQHHTSSYYLACPPPSWETIMTAAMHYWVRRKRHRHNPSSLVKENQAAKQNQGK